MTTPSGYAALYQDTVYAIGRSEAGLARDLVSTEAEIGDTIQVDSTVPCTRRAYDAIKAGSVQVHTPRQVDGDPRRLLVMVGGVLDVPRGRGRPALDHGQEARTVAARLPADLHARLVARAERDGLSSSEAVRAAVEAWVG